VVQPERDNLNFGPSMTMTIGPDVCEYYLQWHVISLLALAGTKHWTFCARDVPDHHSSSWNERKKK
jgi:hypothetical protein